MSGANLDGSADGDEGPDLVHFGISNGDAAIGPVDGAVKAAEPAEAVFKAVNFYVATGRDA